MVLARFEEDFTDEAGNLLTGNVSVEVRRETGGLVPVYSDRAGAVALGNPFINDGGRVAFHCVGGAYKVTVTQGAFSRVRRYRGIGTKQEQDQGQDFAGYGMQWESGTTAPPSAGCVRANNANLSIATKLYVSEVTVAGSDIAARLQEMDSTGKSQQNGIILTQQPAGDTVSWKVSTVVDHTGYKEINVNTHAGETALNVGTISLLRSTTGGDGVDGASMLTRVRVVATTNIAISTGLENGDTVDGVALVTGDLVLLTGQTAPAENGVYLVPASGAAARDTSFDTYNEHPGAYFSVMEGTAKADTLWRCTSNKGGTLGSTALTMTEFTGGGLSGWPEVLRSTNLLPRGSFVRGVEGWGSAFSTDGSIVAFNMDPTSTLANLPAYFSRAKAQLGANATGKNLSVGAPRRIGVDATKKHKLTVAAAGYGAVDPLPSSFQVHCFDGNGAFISTLTANINVVLAPSAPAGYYHATINEIGGSAPAFPTGTVSTITHFGYASTASQGLQVFMLCMIPENELPCAIGTAISNNGGGTHEAASDGTYLYVISHGMNEVAKMSGDLKKVATLSVGDYPHDVVVVGTDLWVCNHDAANLQRIGLSGFTVSNTYAITGSKNGFGLGTDGTRLWLGAGTNAQGCALYEVNVSTGALTLLSTDLNTGAANLPVRYLAGSVWTIHESNSQVKRINPTGGATVATISCSLGDLYGLGTGGGFVFACGTKGVVVIDPATNAVVQTHLFRQLERGQSNVEVSGGFAYACAASGVMLIDYVNNESRELLLDGGANKWARALPDGRVAVGAYAAPWMFILG